MIALLQRVEQASVTVDQQVVASIGEGLLIYLGVVEEDTDAAIETLVPKILSFRLFNDAKGRFDRSVADVKGEILLVSQFTLAGSWRKGRRPGFDRAMTPDAAHDLFDRFERRLREKGGMVKTGVFGAHMKVASINDGPVTFIFDTGAPR